MKKPELLKQFPDNYQGVASNMILSWLRDPSTDEEDKKNERDDKLGFYLQNNGHWVAQKISALCFDLSNMPMIKEAIRYYNKWESLNAEEKQKFKNSDRQYFVAKKMDSEPPSEKQILWLKKNNVEIPKTKLQASKLLDELFKK